MRRSVRWGLCTVVFVSACSSVKPVSYPNAHYQSVGKEMAEQDIELCKQMAESAGAAEGRDAAAAAALRYSQASNSSQSTRIDGTLVVVDEQEVWRCAAACCRSSPL